MKTHRVDTKDYEVRSLVDRVSIVYSKIKSNIDETAKIC